MKTKVEKLEGSRARVDVTIDADELEERVKQAAERMGKEMKISGFREGKVPPEMVLQKAGRQAVVSEALEGSLGDWYSRCPCCRQ